MMDGLSRFEQEFGKPRSKWTKAQWRKVAEMLAGVEVTSAKLRGRPKLTEQDKQNYRVAIFWREQLRDEKSIDLGNEVSEVKPRSRRLTKGEATKEVLKQAIERDVGIPLRNDKLSRKTMSLVRTLQNVEKETKTNKR